MPYNFIPEIATAQLLEEREKVAIAVKRCNREYEGDIKSKGDRVKILTPGEVTIFDYTKDTDMSDPEVLDDAAQFLEISESKAYQYYLDDVDKKQMMLSGAFDKASMKNAAYKLSDTADTFIYNKYSEIAAAQTVTKTGVTSATIISAIASAMQLLRENNVPEGEPKYLEISPDVYTKLVLAKIVKDTDNSKTIDAGYIGKILGFDVYVSNNVVKSSLTSYCLARTKKAIAYAEQINDTESLRHPKRFGDIRRGLHLYGAKIVVPKELVLLNITTTTETTI